MSSSFKLSVQSIQVFVLNGYPEVTLGSTVYSLEMKYNWKVYKG